MVTNGGKSMRDLLAEVECMKIEERVAAEVERRLEEERARDRAEREREAEERMAGVRRSTLSAAEKSAIIRSRGVDFYNQLPW
jgi:hypothetical protein